MIPLVTPRRCLLTIGVIALVVLAGCVTTGPGSNVTDVGDTTTPPNATSTPRSVTSTASTTSDAGDGSTRTQRDRTDTGDGPPSERTETTTVDDGRKTTTDQPDSPPSIAVEGGTLSLSPGTVFAHVERVMGVDVGAPNRIVLLDNASALPGRNGTDVPRFYGLIGLDRGRGLNGTPFERMENGVTYPSGLIYIVTDPSETAGSTEWVLAHEFAHFVNLQLRRPTTLARHVDRFTTDGRYAVRAVREGAAVLTTDAYLARYAPTVSQTAALYPRLLDAVPTGGLTRYGLSQYVFGYEYVAGRVDDPAALDAVFEHPPTTSEQVIHGYAPGTEPPVALNVTVVETDRYRRGGYDRMGEAFVRYALENGVSVERAASAAAGWGVDRLQYVRPRDGGNASYAWILRWDDAANATEFERAFEDSLDTLGTPRGDIWRLGNVTADVRTPTDRTSVILLGSRRLVNGTVVVSSRPGRVTLRLPGAESAA